MDSVTKKLIDDCRAALKEADPYSLEEIFDGSEECDRKRLKATHAKDILVHLGLSLTDPNDYGNITE